MSEARDERPEGERRDVPARVRGLVRRAQTASLSTLLARDGSAHPYVSLVVVACDPAAIPILLLSDLADHSRNLAADPRAALLFDGTAGLADPLTGARAALLGRVERSERREDRDRYLAVNQGARDYADFRDFHFYRLKAERAHLVAGFGRIHWLDAAGLALPGLDPTAFARQAQAGLPRLTERLGSGGLARLAARAGAPQDKPSTVLAAFDPEGCDLLVDGRRWRLDFERPRSDPQAAEAAILALAEG